MKKLLLASAAIFLAVVGTASAADLGRPMYTKAPPAPPPAPVWTWTGFYFGLNVGGKWARTDGSVNAVGPVPDTLTFDRRTDSTVIGGGQIGYNWQAPGSPWVFGIEADADAQHWKTTRTFGGAPVFFESGDTFTLESHWEASVRGRIGYAIWDRALLYATGGAAFTQVKAGTLLVGLPGVTDDKTLVGGTVGGGLEYAFTNSVSLGVEGRWTFYGHQDFSGGVVPGAPGAPATAITQHVKVDTAEVLGKINFRFW